MRITVLASDHPDFQHAGANQIVLGAVLEGLAEAGHGVTWVTAGARAPVSAAAGARLAARGVTFAGDFDSALDFGSTSPVAVRGRYLRHALLPGPDDDLPRFCEPERVAQAVTAGAPDVLLLFWDSWFEHLVPWLNGVRVAGFLAKPRYEAGMIRIRHGLAGVSNRSRVTRWLSQRMLDAQKARHLSRMRRLSVISEICAVDAATYRNEGLPAQYVGLPVPDFFGERWRTRWQQPPAAPLTIIAGLGTYQPLGSTVGLEFIANEVIPRLDRGGMPPWEMHFFGRGPLPPAIQARRDDARLRFPGFVDDIDSELLRHPLFLFCNNASPYSGTYTRVPYALSSGTCMIAHVKLAASVPELVHGENVLLGEDGERVAALVCEAARSPELRRRIGVGARETYEQHFTPRAVGRRLAALLEETSAAA